MAQKPIKTTKEVSARRQINAAIAHLHKGDFECAITLAGAAEGQLPDTEHFYLFKILNKIRERYDPNAHQNWLKHPSGPECITITEFAVTLAISRAIQKFVAVSQSSTKDFEGFSRWAVERGHIPRPLTEKSN
jgi:hypothetical protein